MTKKHRIDVALPSMPTMKEYAEEIQSIWQTRQLTHTGPKHQQLQKELCKYLQTPNIALFANGHLALEGALEVLKLKGEVITTPFTFASTTQAIVHAGLKPVFCDIKEEDFTLDPAKIEALITPDTCAILPVHVYGNLCDHKAIAKIADKHNLKVIYDAAHAFGMSDNGLSAAVMGDVSMFSFHATKVFHTIEGGACTFKDNALNKEFAAWRQFGMYGKEDAQMPGTNAKMTEFAAAMGLCNLRHVDEEIAKRQTVAARYYQRLGGAAGITLCAAKPGVRYNYAYMPVMFDAATFGKSRDAVCGQLAAQNIFARKYFYPLTSSFSCYKGKFAIAPTPVAQKVAAQILTLPLYADLALDDVDRICDIILGKQ